MGRSGAYFSVSWRWYHISLAWYFSIVQPILCHFFQFTKMSNPSTQYGKYLKKYIYMTDKFEKRNPIVRENHIHERLCQHRQRECREIWRGWRWCSSRRKSLRLALRSSLAQERELDFGSVKRETEANSKDKGTLYIGVVKRITKSTSFFMALVLVV